MGKRTISRWTLRILLLVVTGLGLGGCATTGPAKPNDLVPTDRGTVIFQERFEFKRPPAGWAMLKNLEGGDFELGFLTLEKGDFPSQTAFIFDDQPYGSARDLDTRANQYCTRFLFNTGMDLEIKKREKVEWLGLPALALYMEADNPNQKEKARSKVYLIKNGHRIFSFVCTQWRPLGGTFDPAGFDRFEEFVKSFKFLKKTFYENFEEELNKLGV